MLLIRLRASYPKSPLGAKVPMIHRPAWVVMLCQGAYCFFHGLTIGLVAILSLWRLVTRFNPRVPCASKTLPRHRQSPRLNVKRNLLCGLGPMRQELLWTISSPSTSDVERRDLLFFKMTSILLFLREWVSVRVNVKLFCLRHVSLVVIVVSNCSIRVSTTIFRFSVILNFCLPTNFRFDSFCTPRRSHLYSLISSVRASGSRAAVMKRALLSELPIWRKYGTEST